MGKKWDDAVKRAVSKRNIINVKENRKYGNKISKLLGNMFTRHIWRFHGGKHDYKEYIDEQIKGLKPSVYKPSLLSLANVQLRQGAKYGNLELIDNARLIYEKLGKQSNDFFENKSSQALEQYAKKGLKKGIYDENYSENIDNFIRCSSKKNLTRKFAALITLVSAVGCLLFLSPNLTGNAIGNLSSNYSNIIGGVLFLVVIVGAFFSIKNK